MFKFPGSHTGVPSSAITNAKFRTTSCKRSASQSQRNLISIQQVLLSCIADSRAHCLPVELSGCNQNGLTQQEITIYREWLTISVVHSRADCISTPGWWDKTNTPNELAQHSGGWQWQQDKSSTPSDFRLSYRQLISHVKAMLGIWKLTGRCLRE